MQDREQVKEQIARAMAFDDGFNPDVRPSGPFPGLMDNVSYPSNFVRDRYMSKAEAALAVLEERGIDLSGVGTEIAKSAKPKGILERILGR